MLNCRMGSEEIHSMCKYFVGITTHLENESPAPAGPQRIWKQLIAQIITRHRQNPKITEFPLYTL